MNVDEVFLFSKHLAHILIVTYEMNLSGGVSKEGFESSLKLGQFEKITLYQGILQ